MAELPKYFYFRVTPDPKGVKILLEDASHVEVREVVHGRWLKLDMHKGMEQHKCSVCRSECYVPTCMGEPMYDYCPSCGAKMDGGKDDV